jgi:hypothetical protein
MIGALIPTVEPAAAQTTSFVSSTPSSSGRLHKLEAAAPRRIGIPGYQREIPFFRYRAIA